MTVEKQLQSIQELLLIMARLRSPDGCHWDRQQTPESLKKHILEETYELLEAIDSGNTDEICDELGDLLLQVVFQAQIFSESGTFSFSDVANSICSKLKRRHPHIYSDAPHEGHEQRWEEIKKQERTERGQANNLSQRIPATLPALKRATKVAKKCLPGTPLDTIRQLETELQQLKHIYQTPSDNTSSPEPQLGQLLLALCKFAAATGCDPEEILRSKTTKLISEIDSGKEML
jgi:MazG family protein